PDRRGAAGRLAGVRTAAAAERLGAERPGPRRDGAPHLREAARTLSARQKLKAGDWRLARVRIEATERAAENSAFAPRLTSSTLPPCVATPEPRLPLIS